MGKALQGVHALYMENYVCGQILHLHRKGLMAAAIAKKLSISIGFVERTVRNRFGPKGTITGYEILAHWKGKPIE